MNNRLTLWEYVIAFIFVIAVFLIGAYEIFKRSIFAGR